MSKNGRDQKDRAIAIKHIASGETWNVPRDEYIQGRAEKWINEQIAAREEQRAAAEAKQKQETSELQDAQVQLSQLQTLMAEQAKVIEELRAEKAKLERATPEASAATLALLHASSQAQTLRQDLLRDMGAVSDWRSKFAGDIDIVANEVRQRNSTLDEEVAERRRKNAILFDDIREAQGMARQHPELLPQETNEG